jgi:hypothetical protein
MLIPCLQLYAGDKAIIAPAGKPGMALRARPVTFCKRARLADQRSLDQIREYIASNPANWAQDRENPDVVRQPKER